MNSIKQELKHTPLPWTVTIINEQVLIDSDKKMVLHGAPCASMPDEENRVNAALIVRAVNSHEELLDMVYRAIPYIEEAIQDPANKPESVRNLLNQMKKAIANAEGK